MYAFGKMMRKLIAKHGTTQAEISRATGIKKQNLSVICKGETQYPSTSFSFRKNRAVAHLPAVIQHEPH